MPTLRLTEEQQALILRLARPLPVQIREAFYQRLSAELVNLPAIGDGMLYRLAAKVQREMLAPPILDGADDL
jgi:hypothetical protein